MDKSSTNANNIITIHPSLVEIVVEVRWEESVIGKIALPSDNSSYIPRPVNEQLFKIFSEKVAQHGFLQSERMVPSGFPIIPPFAKIYRYQKSLSDNNMIVYQLGSDIFSINIKSSNQSWSKDFDPMVREGIELLLASRRENDEKKNEPFHHVSLRYLNIFNKNLTHGLPVINFLGKLGFKIELPNSIIQQATSFEEIKPQLKISLPLKFEQQMILELTEISKNDEKVLMMNSMILDKSKPLPNIERIMSILQTAHGAIKEIFLEMKKNSLSTKT